MDMNSPHVPGTGIRIKNYHNLNFRWNYGYFWYDRKKELYCLTTTRDSTFKPQEIDCNGEQISSEDYQFSGESN